jgi:hypothetical protein
MTSFQGLVRPLLFMITGSVAQDLNRGRTRCAFMKRAYAAFLALTIALLAPVGQVYAQQLVNPVISDIYANTAMGTNALLNVTPFQPSKGNGAKNTAAGYAALETNTSGYQNTAFGVFALGATTTGGSNTACGAFALGNNQTGDGNTASGLQALELNTTGSWNTAHGVSAQESNVTGSYNTAVGVSALGLNEGGSNNIAVGANAGLYVRGGHYNIEIGNVGGANDAGAIRIGTSSKQSTAYIAGVSNSLVTGAAVYVTSSGQLGVLASSERYKTDVASMASSSEKVKELRPVTFHLRSDPKAGVQYGLIAEEVAKVYPELVIRGDKGQIEGVRYEELTPMLLNEIQRQQAQLHDMQQQLAELQAFRRSMQRGAANH